MRAALDNSGGYDSFFGTPELAYRISPRRVQIVRAHMGPWLPLWQGRESVPMLLHT
jgi:hypothetical protein